MPHCLPDFIIIGAMKAGTTSLYEYLTSHPRITPAKKKEPSFFADPNWNEGIHWYQQHFQACDKLQCEASTNYTKYPAFGPVAKRMYQVVPGAKLIYLLRHPVERAISQIHFMNAVNRRKPKLLTVEGLGDKHRSGIWFSQYFYQISQFLEYYDIQQIRCVRFEDLIADPAKVLNELLVFLGLNAGFYNSTLKFEQYNDSRKNSTIRLKVLHRYLNKANRYQFIPPVHKFLETPVPRPQLTAEARQFIWDAVAEDLTCMENLLGRSLDYKPPV